MTALTLDDLAPTPRWVAWRNESRDGKTTKIPYSAPGRKAEADNPATWCPRAAAEAVAAHIVNGLGGGIGIELGELPEGFYLAGLDLDTCRAPDGTIEPWAADVIARIGTYTEVSPSGSGIKLFFVIASADMPALRKAMETEHSRIWKRPGGEHPPSIELHVSNRYFAVTAHHLQDTPADLLPVPIATLLWIVREAGPAFVAADSAQDSTAGRSGGSDQSRSAVAFKKGAALHRAGKTFEEMVEALRADPETADWCRDKGEANRQRELRRIWEKAASSKWIDPTEDAVAQAFASKYAGRYVHDHTSGFWHVWKDGRWARDTRNSVFNAARDFTRLARAGLNEPPSGMAKIAFAAAVERGARADPRLAVSQEIWDRDPWLLGVPGGVVDLRTGQMQEAAADLYIARQCSVAPAPLGTPAPLWTAFLEDATNGDKELQGFLQRLAGYVLTGLVNEEVLTFIYGSGGNGKGVFIGAITTILAEYAVAVPIEMFTAGSYINLEYYRAQIAGARLVTASETEAQATWSQAHLTEATGNEAPLSARHPYGQPFTYWPQFKIVLIGNYAPKLKGRSPAMERRLRIAPFNHKPDKPDPDLKAKLKAEHPAILRWMLDGCLMWQRNHLGTAPAIAAATSAYFEQQDTFRRWIEERCLMVPTFSTRPGTLLADFNAWARDNAEEPMGSNAFAELIDRTPGLIRSRTHGVRGVRGIGLRLSRQAAADDADE